MFVFSFSDFIPKISIRNIRREANDTLKNNLKEKAIGEDEFNKYEKKLTQ